MTEQKKKKDMEINLLNFNADIKKLREKGEDGKLNMDFGLNKEVEKEKRREVFKERSMNQMETDRQLRQIDDMEFKRKHKMKV